MAENVTIISVAPLNIVKSVVNEAVPSLVWDKKHKTAKDKDTLDIGVETYIDLEWISSRGTTSSAPLRSKAKPSL